jgi:hypothetical protein
MMGSILLTSSIGKGSYSRGESPSSVEDSCVEFGSSKLGGDGTTDKVCVVEDCCVGGEFFLPAGSTAANAASMPLATFWGRGDLAAVDVIGVAPGDDRDLGDAVFDWAGLKTSYFVDHLRVFS